MKKNKLYLAAIPFGLFLVFIILFTNLTKKDSVENFLTFEVKPGLVEDVVSTTGATVDEASYVLDTVNPPLLVSLFGTDQNLNSNDRFIEGWTVKKVFLEAGSLVNKNDSLISVENIDGTKRTIKSPFKGRVIEMNSVKGFLAEDGFSTIGAGDFIVKAAVSVNEVKNIKLNMPIALLINDTNTQTSGIITSISPSASGSIGDKGESAYEILIKVTPGAIPDLARAGMSVTYDVIGTDGARIRYTTGELINEYTYSMNVDGTYNLVSKFGTDVSAKSKVNVENYLVEELMVGPGSIVKINDSILKLRNLDGSIKTIKSPMQGIVRELFTVDRAYISGKILKLGTGGIFANVQVSEFDITKLKVDQEVDLFIGNQVDSIKGKVISIGQTSSIKGSSVTQYDVIIEPAVSAQDLLVDMSVSARIILTQKNASKIIPIQALIEENNQYFVNLLNPEGLSSRVEIKIGVRGTQYIEVISGVDLGDKVIIGKGSDSLEIPTSNDPFADQRSERVEEQTNSSQK